jgi:hypothetical protein
MGLRWVGNPHRWIALTKRFMWVPIIIYFGAMLGGLPGWSLTPMLRELDAGENLGFINFDYNIN